MKESKIIELENSSDNETDENFVFYVDNCYESQEIDDELQETLNKLREDMLNKFSKKSVNLDD